MLAFVAAALCGLAQPGQPESSPPPDRIAWIKEHAIPLTSVEAGHGFEDLQPLKALIGDARVVALGEGTHGTREFFQMKHRLVEFLVSEMGFTVFSIEANMPEAYAVDEYASHGQGDLRRLIEGMYFWTWRTEEVADMVRWMWKFNREEAAAGGSRHVKFTGFDMQTPDVAMRVATEFLKKSDPEYAREAEQTWSALKKGDKGNTTFGVATATLPAAAAAGHHLVFSGWIKTRSVRNGYAGLWCRVDGEKGVLSLDNMEGRGATGNTGWVRYQIDADVPKDARNINFGVIMPGTGTAWFDDLAVTIDGNTWSDEAVDLGFEAEQLKGFVAPGEEGGYRVSLDHAEAHGGKQSLRMDSKDGAATAPTARDRVKLAKAVLDHMQAHRETYLKDAPAERVDWAIQNAAVVEQWSRLKAGSGLVRDECMAANVAWILEHSPPGTRIVLWAHNGHVERKRGTMGSHLARKFGKDYVVLGFATSTGRYSAIGDNGLTGHDLAPPPEGTLEWHLAAAGLPRLILPVRDVPADDPASSWLAEWVPMRSIGAMAMKEQFYPELVSTAYDGIVYIRDTTEAKQLPRP